MKILQLSQGNVIAFTAQLAVISNDTSIWEKSKRRANHACFLLHRQLFSNFIGGEKSREGKKIISLVCVLPLPSADCSQTCCHVTAKTSPSGGRSNPTLAQLARSKDLKAIVLSMPHICS